MPGGMPNLQVNGERLWASLMELAEIGATPKGGVCRLAASDLDGEARRLFIGWCEAAGCTVRVDKIGNIFARRPGRDPGLPPVGWVSRWLPVMTGGKFDGAYGVMAGLELVRTLNDLGYETEAPRVTPVRLSGLARPSARSKTPANTPEPTIAGEKREPSSLVQATISIGASVS